MMGANRRLTHQRGAVTSPRAPILGLTVGLVDWDRKLSRASGLCPLTDRRTARGWPAELPGGGRGYCPGSVGQGRDPLLVVAWVRRMLSPAVSTTWAWCRNWSTVALAMVLGMSSSKPGGVQVRGERDGAFLVGGVDDAVERFGGLGGHGQQADVVDDDHIGAEDLADGAAGRVVDSVPSDEDAKLFKTEPRDVGALVDGGVAECFEEVALAGARWTTDDDVLVAVDPLEGPQRSLGGLRDGGDGLVPSVEGLAGREPGRLATRPDRRGLSSGELLGGSARIASAGSQRWAFAVASRSGAAARMWGSRNWRNRSTTSSAGFEVVVIGRSLPTRRCRSATNGPHRRNVVVRAGSPRGSCQVTIGEPAEPGGVTERPVDPADTVERCEFDRFAHLHLDPCRPSRGGLDEPEAGAVPQREERLLRSVGRLRCAAGPVGAWRVVGVVDLWVAR